VSIGEIWQKKSKMAWGILNLHKSGEDPSTPEITPTNSHPEKTASPTTQEISSTERIDVPKFEKAHQFDPNLPQEKIDALHAAQAGDTEAVHEVEAEFAEHSPYAEVRAAVRVEDGEEVANTVRAWILGMIFVTLGAGANMFLSMRSPAINFPAIVVQL
jgi:hypothetical protein